ncbi:hypothetical protein [Enterococcus sp. RIT-PI-f]|nr:hypothetical protein [Enterococcus sp. RIT-PI-f]
MKFHTYKDADKTFFAVAITFFILGIGMKFFWFPALLFLLAAFLKK